MTAAELRDPSGLLLRTIVSFDTSKLSASTYPLPVPKGSLGEILTGYHRGVEYTLIEATDGECWLWRFRIGDIERTGRIKARLGHLAERRLQLRIDKTLRAMPRKCT